MIFCKNDTTKFKAMETTCSIFYMNGINKIWTCSRLWSL